MSVTVLALVGLTACGDDEEQDNTKTEAKALADQAVAAMDKIEFLSNKGSGTDENGNPIGIDACAVMKTKDVKGTLKLGDESAEMLEVGRVRYIKATPLGWAQFAGRPGDARVADLFEQASEGKFVKSEPEPGDAATVDFFDGKTDNVTKGAVTTFQGKDVVPLVQERDEDGDKVKKTYYIAAKGEPVIVGQVEETVGGKEREETVFTKTDKCEVSAPPADQVIEEAEFNKRVDEAQGN
ncbi:hypothetical protein [Streptodolium elevatio]